VNRGPMSPWHVSPICSHLQNDIFCWKRQFRKEEQYMNGRILF
jgi:hypothetical protein